MGFWTTHLPPAAAQYIFLKCQLFTSYWALLETKVLTRPHLVLFCTQVPKMPWVRHASWQKFSTVTDTSFVKWKWYLQGRVKPDLKAFSTLPKDVASNMLSPLPENLVELVAVPPLPPPLATWEVPWDQLSEMNRELPSFISGSATALRDAAHGRVTAFYPASGTSLLSRVLPAQPNWRNS